MEPLALMLAAALAFVLFLRSPGALSPVLVAEGMSRAPATPGDEEEQLPETDRAPRPWLPWAVGAVAALRVALLFAMRA